MPSKGKVNMFLGNPLPIKISINNDSYLMLRMGIKGKDINNEIYNWLLPYKVCVLEDVALFDPDILYGLWQTQASDRWEEHKDNAFYQFLNHCEMLDI
jgi:hypothetical protein